MFKVGDKVVLKKNWRSVKGSGNADVKWIVECLGDKVNRTFTVTRFNDDGLTMQLKESNSYTLNVKAFEHVDWLDALEIADA
jgi:hypothetical protein